MATIETRLPKEARRSAAAARAVASWSKPIRSQAGMLFQQQGAVATATESGIDQQAIRTGDLPGRIQHRIGQHGHMAEGGHKPQAKTP